MTSFDQRIIAVSGSPESIAAIARAYGVKHRKVPTRSGYTFDHSSAVFLLDRTETYPPSSTRGNHRTSDLPNSGG
jgi:protein SCO1/2